MDAILLNVKSLTEKFIKSDCMCNPNYFRYKEGAKLCLCENEYRKLKNYVGYCKYLEHQDSIHHYVFDELNIKAEGKYILSIIDTTEAQRGVAMFMITEIEKKLEYLNARKIVTNSSYTEIHDKVKLLKKAYPEAVALSTQLREIKNKLPDFDVRCFRLSCNIAEHTSFTRNEETYKNIRKLKESN